MKRLTLTLGLLALAATLAACSGASANPATPAAPAGSPSGDAVSVVAKDLKFTTPAVSAPAGKPFTIAFDNQDGAPHNIVISDPTGTKVFKGDDRHQPEGRLPGPGPRGGQLQLPVRGPPRHEGHDHRPVTARNRHASDAPATAGAFGVPGRSGHVSPVSPLDNT